MARVALGLIVASMLVIGPSADAASTHTSPDQNQPGPVYPGTFSEYQDPAKYQKPEYPNHKPVRGNYPGTYPSSPSTPVQQPGSQFDWLAAGVGAAGMLGLILLLTAVRTGARRARNRSHDVPLVVQVDDRPGVG